MVKITTISFNDIFVPADEKKILKALNALDSLDTEDINPKSKPVKLFNAIGGGTWEIILFNPETKMAFGLCDLGVGFPELGYVSVAELFKSVPMLEKDKFYNLTWKDVLDRMNL